MRESWTDARMDDLNTKVDELGRRMDNGFNRVDADLRAQRSETKAEFTAVRGELAVMQREMNARFEGMQRTMLQAAVAMSTAFIAGFAALTGLIATQL